ncbi:MAG: beta-lactamase-like protein 2 [Candidatus Binatia bacterium]|nr:beta-lactamase-like protein 2 [Candidatus Binatia bacterium]
MPQRIVTDSMAGLRMPDFDVWSERVATVLGQNPGPFTGPGTNTYLIGTGKRPILLDTGIGLEVYDPLLVRGLAETKGARELQEILLTHVHQDHIGGVAQVRARFGELKVSKKAWPGKDEAYNVPLTYIEDGACITTDGATLRAIHTPGHAQDHLCYYLEEEKALFTGDLVLGAGTTVVPEEGGGLIAYMASLRKLLTFDIAVIYPAHGPAIRDPYKKLRDYIAHRELREQQILDALQAGMREIPSIVKRIYTDVPEFLHDAAGNSVLSHLLKLQKEGVVRREGTQWFLL